MIRKMEEKDRSIFLELAEEFYHSDAVLHPVPASYHTIAFNEIMDSDIYLCGYLFEWEGEIAGYAMTSKAFSQEVGGLVLWIEEAFIREPYRNKGLGRELFEYLEQHKDKKITRMRLEVEKSNEKAMALYERMGFSGLEYIQMIKDFPNALDR